MDWKNQTFREKVMMVIGIMFTLAIIIYCVYRISELLNSVYAVPIILIGLILYVFWKKE